MNASLGTGRKPFRTVLGEVVPLRTPFTVFINPSTLCNFKCFYCTHGKTSKELNEMNFVQKNMDIDTFKKILEQVTLFEDKLKLIYLYGNGEPLCNPKFAYMTEALSRLNVSESIETFTNAALLTHDLSKDIISAGLTKLKISIQGVNSTQYKNVMGQTIDFENLVNQIQFFYDHRKNCQVYIKIIDTGLSENDKQKFFKTFGDCCDQISIEHLTYTQRTMDKYSTIIEKKVNLFGEPLLSSEVCPFPFYTIRIGVSGEINPCFEQVFDAGNVNVFKTTLKEYWLGPMRKKFLLMHLHKERNKKNTICNGCLCASATTFKEDVIDDYAEDVLKRLSE